MNEKALVKLEYNKIIDALAFYAGSQLGKEKCLALLPSTDIDEIRLNQARTSSALSLIYKKGSVSFMGIKNIFFSLERLKVGSSLNISELLAISNVLSVARRVLSYVGDDITSESLLPLADYFQSISSLPALNNEIQRCIISEEEISDEASSTLSNIRRSIKNCHTKIQQELSSLLNNSNTRTMLQDSVITLRNNRYCLPVKAEYKSSFQGMLHDQSASGSTLFIEPSSIVKLNNDIREYELKEEDEIQRILATLSELAAAHIDELELNTKMLSELDFIFAKASYSKHLNATEPIFNQNKYINIKKGRHPLLDAKKVVPIDVTLGKDFSMLIITGPNTGGKTVTLKTVGLLTLMGQSGLHIPAFDNSELAVYDDIFADIGDEQSIEQSLSTFSSHMTNIVGILKAAYGNSLLLFDELGAGTDPIEGAALAIAILKKLHLRQVSVIATTHYSELKLFALSSEGVENASCEFDVISLKPTYRLIIGIPGKSNAFAISKRLGLSDDIIEEADKVMTTSDKDFETLIAELNETKASILKERQEAERYKTEAKNLQLKLNSELEKLSEKKEKIIRKANEEATEILSDAKAFADETIRNITKIQSTGIDYKQLESERLRAREKLNKTSDKLAFKPKATAKQVSVKEITKGTKVKVLSLGLEGIIVGNPNSKGDVAVQMGILKSIVNIKELAILDEVNEITTPNKTGAGQIGFGKALSIKSEINLIGKTTDEAISELDKYLDDAHLTNLTQVSIVHGKGTGALRSAVHSFLKKNRYVKSYRLGVFGEGDAGVTIVELK